MNQFQKAFEDKYTIIRKRTKAFLATLYPPMRCIGMRGTVPSFVQVGRALFDTIGWIPHLMVLDTGVTVTVARTIGIEVKDNKNRHPSMRIVGADGNGSGLQSHQLEALAAVHRDGGIAKVLWNNGGVVGVLDGEEIASVFHSYGVSLAAEKLHKVPAKGSRSIPWSLFRPVNMDEAPEATILVPIRQPTLAESLAAKRRKAARLIDIEAAKRAEEDDTHEWNPGNDPDDE